MNKELNFNDQTLIRGNVAIGKGDIANPANDPSADNWLEIGPEVRFDKVGKAIVKAIKTAAPNGATAGDFKFGTNADGDLIFQVGETIINLSGLISNQGNASFKGIISPTDNPGIPAGPEFRISTIAGLYSNLGTLTLSPNSIGIFSWNGTTWSLTQTTINADLTPYTKNADFNLVKDKTEIIQNNTDYPGYLLPVFDSDNHFLGGWLKDGSFQISKWLTENIPNSAIANGAISLSKLAGDVLASFAPSILASYFPAYDASLYEWLFPVLDADEKVLGGWKKDGRWYATSYGKQSIPQGSLEGYSDLIPESGFIYAVVDKKESLIFGVKTDGSFYASKFSYVLPDGSVSIGKLTTDLQALLRSKSNLIPCFGDSLTAGAGGIAYPFTLQSLVGNGYAVVNCGVGGESVTSIAARQGGVPALITSAFVLPANTTPVEISSNSNVRIKSQLNGIDITPLLQGDGNSVNPCYVQGVECTLAYTENAYNDPLGTWTIRRNVAASASLSVIANSKLIFSGAKKYRNCPAMVIFIGQNGGYYSDGELVDYYKRMVDFSGCSNYVLVGLHSGTAASRAALENTMELAFGHRYFNWRKYISNYGIADAGMVSTQADLDAMAIGSAPPQLLSDAVHLNTAGYTLLANQVYKLFVELNYL